MSHFVLVASCLLILALGLAKGAGRMKRRVLEFAVLLVLGLPLLTWLWSEAALPHYAMPVTVATLTPAEPVRLMVLGAQLVWAIGLLFGVIRLTLRLHGVARWLKESKPLSHQSVSEIGQALDLSSGTVKRRFRQANSNRGPALLPVVPGRILLPVDWQKWTPRQRQAALLHEWHHAQNHDAHWSLLMDIMTVILWFHPLAWLMRSQWRDEIEHRADHAALRHTDAVEYASDLLLIITSVQHRTCPAGVGFADTGSSRRFRRRIMRLFDSAVDTKRGWCFAIAGTVVLLSTALIGIACRVQPEPGELAREIRLRLEANPFPADR